MKIFRSSRPEVSCKKGVLKNFAKFTGNQPAFCNFIKNETLAQLFSSEICEISKSNFFIEHLRWLLLNLTVRINIEHCNLTLGAYKKCK